MVEIVSGYHADNVFDGFLSALGVLSEVSPLRGRERFQEREIRFAHHALDFDRFAWVALFVVSPNDP
jgi:hypothetical protein